MEGFRVIDIYSTKGIEYLVAGGFFFAFMALLSYMSKPAGLAHSKEVLSDVVEWFRVPENLFFHRGHSWMKPAGADLASVGMDDYAQKLLGGFSSVALPEVGTQLVQGEKAWSVNVDGKTIPMLSPVDGKVVAVNKAAVADPGLINRDPFGAGWLVKVEPAKLSVNLKNLLSGKLARQWVEDAVEGLRMQSGATVGATMQDGGIPVDGIARALYGDEWTEKVKEQFLTAE
jgi:glycine cleavage system H lipoate-binding protein